MRSKSILSGVNVPISPTSNTDTKLTNNISINNFIPQSSTESLTTPQNDAAYPKETDPNPYSGCSSREADTDRTALLENYLLKVYQNILLSENKKLVANVVSKESIILTQEDLERVIELKVSKKCVITTEPYDVGCLNSSKVFLKIDSIRITEETNAVPADFKIKFNKDYLELVTNYRLNLKFVLVN